jgi:phosphoribosylformylglycinamidine synthase subunit PurS
MSVMDRQAGVGITEAQACPKEVPAADVRTVRVTVTLKPGVLDAPGQAIRQGLAALGHGGVHAVRAGRYFEVEMQDDERLDRRIREMCDGFLANTLIEEYRYEVV